MAEPDSLDFVGADGSDDPEQAMRDARQRFIAAFPKRADSIGLLLNMVLTLGPKGPVRPLREVVHRTAGLAGTLGFPHVSDFALELEELLDQADHQLLDAAAVNDAFDSLREAFTEDLAAAPTWAIGARKATGSRRIMLVEDDEDQREVVSIHLRSAGYTVVPVEQGGAVIEAAREHRPDLILLDANLPGLDGYAVCRLLKADPRLARTPVIFTTVRAKADDKAVGLLLGADEYLTKPLDLHELVLRISLLLERADTRVTRDMLPVAASGDSTDLDYESFVAVAREHISRSAAVVALIEAPEPWLAQTYAALRGDLRRRDLVTTYDASHLVLLMAGMPADRAGERIAEALASVGQGTPVAVAGLAFNAGPGAASYEMLLIQADEAVAAAKRQGHTVAFAHAPAQAPVRPRS
jgi:DNA-binding response OmpR family regulator